MSILRPVAQNRGDVPFLFLRGLLLEVDLLDFALSSLFQPSVQSLGLFRLLREDVEREVQAVLLCNNS